MAGTRQGGRPARTVRWRREASTDHSREGGAETVDAFPFTVQDQGPGHPPARRYDLRAWQHPQNCETRECPVRSEVRLCDGWCHLVLAATWPWIKRVPVTAIKREVSHRPTLPAAAKKRR